MDPCSMKWESHRLPLKPLELRRETQGTPKLETHNCESSHSLPGSADKEGLPRQLGYQKDLILTNKYPLSLNHCYGGKNSIIIQQVLWPRFSWSWTSEHASAFYGRLCFPHPRRADLLIGWQRERCGPQGTPAQKESAPKHHMIHQLRIYWD